MKAPDLTSCDIVEIGLSGTGPDECVCRFGDWNVKETDWLNSNPCISGKPVVYLINLNEDKYIKKKSKWLPKVSSSPLLTRLFESLETACHNKLLSLHYFICTPLVCLASHS